MYARCGFLDFDGLVEGFKEFYFSLEDKYYDFLDGVDEKFPIYSIIDPIDRFVPSFILFILLFLGILFGVGLLLAGGFSNPSNANAIGIVKVVDLQGNVMKGIPVTFTPDGAVKSTAQTNAQGLAQFSMTKNEQKVRLQVLTEGFVEFDETILVKAGVIKLISLSALERIASLEGAYVLRFKDKSTNLLIKDQQLSVSFGCASGIAVPAGQTTADGKVTVEKKAECETLYASVTPSHSYQPMHNIQVVQTPQDFLLEPIASVSQTGFLNITVKNNASGPVIGATVTISTPAEPSVSQSSTNSAGKANFELPAGTYFVSAFVPADGRAASGSSTVVAGETARLELNVGAVPTDSKKIFLRVIDKNSHEPLSSVQIKIFKGSSLLASLQSDLNGLVEQPVVPSSGTVFSVVLSHSSFLLKVIRDAPIQNAASATPTIVELTARQTDPKNFGEALAQISSVSQAHISDARVYLFESDYANPLVGPLLSNESGEALFSNLPLLDSNAKYFVQAIKDGMQGVSAQKVIPVGQRVEFPVQLQEASGNFKLKVKNRESLSAVSFATVRVFSLQSGISQVLQTGFTDAQGEFESIPVSVNQTVFFEVAKTGFLTHTTAGFQPVANQTVSSTVFLTQKTADQNAIFLEFNQLLNADGTPAQVLEAGKRYWASFSLGLTQDADYNAPIGHIEAGDRNLLLASENPWTIKNAAGFPTNLQPIIFSKALDPAFPFSNPVPVGSETAAKQVNVPWSHLPSGSFEVRVALDTNSNAADGTSMKLFFQSKARLIGTDVVSPMLSKEFIVGESVCTFDCSAFFWRFFYAPRVTGVFVPVTQTPVIRLNQDESFDVKYQLYNLTNAAFSNAALALESDYEIDLDETTAFSNRTLAPGLDGYGMTNPLGFLASHSSSSAAIFWTLDTTPQVDDGSNLPVIRFEIVGSQRLNLNYSLDTATSDLTIVVTDSGGTAVQGATVKIQKACVFPPNDLNAFVFNNPPNATYQSEPTDSDGTVIFSGYPIASGDCAVVAAYADDFAPEFIQIIGGEPPSPSNSLDCILIDANPATPELDNLFDEIQRGNNYPINVISNNCPDAKVQLHSLDTPSLGDLVDPSTEIEFNPRDFTILHNQTKSVSVIIHQNAPLGYIPIIAFVTKPGAAFGNEFSAMIELVVRPHVAPSGSPVNREPFGLVEETP